MNTATFRLRYETGATDVADCASLVFGHIARIAGTIMIAYQSDLYHDALWLRDYMKGSSYRFIWSVDETGTVIGDDTDDVAHRQNRFAFEVTCIDGATKLKITDLTGSNVDLLSPTVAKIEGATVGD